MFIRGILGALIAFVCLILTGQPVNAQGRADVWAVGSSNGGSGSQTLIEHWDGNTWSIVPSPNVPGSVDNSLTAVTAVSSHDVWAAGAYYTVSRSHRFTTHGLTEQWGGLQWAIGPPSKHNLMSLSSVPQLDDDVWAVGWHTQFFCRQPLGCGSNPFAYRWTGREWKETSVPNPDGEGSFYGVQALPGGIVWAVGNISKPSGNFVALIERWSSGAWSVLAGNPFPHGALEGVTGTSDSDIWVTGVTSSFSFFAAHWDGFGWTKYRVGKINALTEVSPNDVWAVGCGGATTFIEHWNGVRWSVVPAPSPGTFANCLNGVSATSTDDIWAVGFYGDSAQQKLTLVEHWDGSAWSLVMSPNPSDSGDELDGVAAVPVPRSIFYR